MDLYTRQEAADYLKVNESTIKYYITKELLPAFKKGKQWLILETDLKSFENSDWFINRKPGARTNYPIGDPRFKKIVAHNLRSRKKPEQKRLEANADN